jgi:hypothetical protein
MYNVNLIQNGTIQINVAGYKKSMIMQFYDGVTAAAGVGASGSHDTEISNHLQFLSD